VVVELETAGQAAPEALPREARERVREACGENEAEVGLRPSRAVHVLVLSSVVGVEAVWLTVIGYVAIRLI
jgi:hypothetical protein